MAGLPQIMARSVAGSSGGWSMSANSLPVDQVGLPAFVAEGFAGDGGVVDQLVADFIAQVFVFLQILLDVVVVGQFVGPAYAMDEDDLLEALVGFRVVDQAHEGRQAGAGGEHEEALAGLQVAQDQRAGRLLADQQLVAGLEVLQQRGQRAVRHLDAEEFQVLLVIGAGDAVGTHAAALDFQADGDELAVDEAQGLVARGAEAEQGVVPVMDGKNGFGIQGAHGSATRNAVVRLAV
jgi:hypothetical protein